ncbi:MAG: hypothetical protein M1823_000135 [Watsoniomyces obsoletus]|nr:MAG: hypothetical protein M1823_000135 [Watsoniomyces obsoletus]
MAGKRKISTRLRDAAAVKQEPSPEQDVEDETPPKKLPFRVDDGKPLPILKEPQPESLPDDEYQSIDESGVYEAALKQSCEFWVSGGIFEQYWSKSSRKKTATDAQARPKENMVKLGPALMWAGPHMFDIVLYGVKPQQAPRGSSPHQSPAPKQSIPRISGEQALQLPQPAVTPTPAIPPRAPGEQGLYRLPPINVPPMQSKPGGAPQWPVLAGTSPSARALIPKMLHARNPPQQPPPPPTHRTLQPSPKPKHIQPTHPTLPAPQPKPDPIIELLAAKAATDLKLKELMKTVAAGNANADELRIFQEHIEDLRKLAESRREREQYSSPSTHREPTHNRPTPGPTLAPIQSLVPTPPQHQHQHPVVARKTQPTARDPSTNHLAPSPAVGSPSNPALRGPPAVKEEQGGVFRTHSPGGLRPSRSGRPSPSTSVEFTAVVFEFTSRPSERFLFPKYSILYFDEERLNVIVEFMAVLRKKPSDATHDSKQKYYELTQFQLSAPTAKILEPLTRVVAHGADMQKHMDEIRATAKSAEMAYLALRLPKDPDAKEKPESNWVTQRWNPDRWKWDCWTPPGSMRPILP